MATVRCEEIANEKFAYFSSNEVSLFYILKFCFVPFIARFLLLISTPINFLFKSCQDWCEIEESVQAGPVHGFGKKLSSIIGTCLSE